MMEVHLKTFLKMTDKDAVKNHLRHFIHSCAFLGHTEGVNMEQISQLLRRLHKTPSEVHMDQLLDFFVMLAISKQFYGDFDPKSKAWVQTALELVDQEFTGSSHVMVTGSTDIKRS